MKDHDELVRLLDNLNLPTDLRDDVTVTVSFYGPDDKFDLAAELEES